MLKKIGQFLLAKESNAIIIAFIAALLPVFDLPTGFIAVLIVGLVTLQKGVKSGFWVLSWVALPTIALMVTRHIKLFDVFDVFTLRCVVIWALASLLRRYQSWGLLLEIVSLTGLAIILALHWWQPQLEQWWVTHISVFLQQMLSDTKVKDSAELSTKFAQQMAPMATGAITFLISLTVLIELAIVRWWQSYLDQSGLFAKEAIDVRAGKIAVLLALLFLALTLMKYSFAMDALVIVLLPLFLSGLSFLHFMARHHTRLVYLLILIYAGFIFLPVLVVSLVAGFAFIDTWVNFRKKIRGNA